MTITLQTAIRQIATASHELQQYERLHLTRERFRLEKGVWVRRTYFEPKHYDLVFDLTGKLDEAAAERLLQRMEDGLEPPPGE
jgi:hypothetical protein